MRNTIKRILKESIKDKIINQIDKLGLYAFMKMSGMSYPKIFSIAGNDWITNKVMIDFIKDDIRDDGVFSVLEIGYDPILYGKTNDEYREISYFSKNYVYVDVYSGNNNLGDFKVMYENLSDNILKECFDLVMDAYEEGVFGE